MVRVLIVDAFYFVDMDYVHLTPHNFAIVVVRACDSTNSKRLLDLYNWVIQYQVWLSIFFASFCAR